MSTAWAFLVVSSSSSEQLETLPHQRAWCDSAAAANGWEITREFRDSCTGKKGVRRLFNRLLTELRATPRPLRPQRILMIRRDRIGRGSIASTLQAQHELKDLGCIIHTRDGGDQSLDGVGELNAAMTAYIAGEENRVRSDKSRAFNARKKAAGEATGMPPYGFTVVDKRLVPYEPEAAIIREMFKRRATGWGVHRLSEYATQNAPAKILISGKRRKLRWSEATVSRMVKNRVYRGTIVDENTWDAATSIKVETRERRGRCSTYDFPLRGAVRCTCGLMLTVVNSGPMKYRIRYYICKAKNRHGCYPHHRAENLERQFLDLLARIELSPELLEAYRGRVDPDRLAALRHQRGGLENERASLGVRRTRAWEAYEDRLAPGEDLKLRLEQIKADDERLQRTIAAIDAEIVALSQEQGARDSLSGLLDGIRERWPRFRPEHQRDIAKAVSACIGGFWCDPERRGVLLAPHDAQVNANDKSLPIME